jgi:hypothetical protein
VLLMRPENAVIHIESRTGCPGIVSEQTLRRWRSHQRGPEYVRLEGRIYYPQRELDRWLQKTGVAIPEESPVEAESRQIP